MADIASLTEALKSLLLDQHDSQRELATLKKAIASRAKQIEALSDSIDDLYRASHN